ncbi:g4576 [Coccomyxa elongata]
MREIDEKAHALQAEAEAASRKQLEEAALRADAAEASPPSKRLRTSQAAAAQSSAAAAALADGKLEEDMRKLLHYSEEKIGLAQQIYDYVDQRIRRLDKDLKAFETDIAKERARLGIPEGETATGMLPQADEPVGSGRGGRGTRGGRRGGRGRRGGLHALGRGGLTQGPGLPPLEAADAGAGGSTLDPTEPVYCYCRRVSFGEMVACDNPDCPVEWFHFECVGMDAQPKGKWYCRDCEALKEAGKLPP